MERGLPLHYFKGKARRIWGDHVFFSDANNVAVVEANDLFIGGCQVSSRGLALLEKDMKNIHSDGYIEFHSYVTKYPRDYVPPWPYRVRGKKLWRAVCAWIHRIPYCIKHSDMNIIKMPISYYTGKLIRPYNDHNYILFGDSRNSVMVHVGNFYCNDCSGGGVNEMIENGTISKGDSIHAYVIRLEVLANGSGPEPDLPGWPQAYVASDRWVAMFAWYGEMPEVLREEVGRYYLIRMNQWENIGESNDQWKNRDLWQGYCDPVIPRGQYSGFMNGSLLIANDTQGIMTSNSELIAFNKNNFYVHGQPFKRVRDLDLFFKNRKVSLNALVMPLDKPKVIFDINVIWYAVCVWCGNEPQELEYIRNDPYVHRADNLDETCTPYPLTHFTGLVDTMTSESGVLLCSEGLVEPVTVSFEKKVLYIHGTKFHNSATLQDKQSVLGNNVWSVLAYPEWATQMKGIPVTGTQRYKAVVMWLHDDHYLMNVIPDIIEQFVSETRRERKKTVEVSGYIVKEWKNHGIMHVRTDKEDPVFLDYWKDDLYVNGTLCKDDKSLYYQSLEGIICYAEVKLTRPRKVDNYVITVEPTLMWIGKRPEVQSSKGINELDDMSNTGEIGMETCLSPEKLLYTGEREMVGNIFIVDKHFGIVICSDIVAGFSVDNFYVDKKKFLDSYDSLIDFCTDGKIVVRALVSTLKQVRTFLSCMVACEAICLWIGREPNERRKIDPKKKTKALDELKTSPADRRLVYFRTQMKGITKEVTLLEATVPGGNKVNICFSKEKLFINGMAVHKEDNFEQQRRNYYSQHWSVLAYSIPTKDIEGHSVSYSALVVWDVGSHHKMRKVLSTGCYKIRTSVEKQPLKKDSIEKKLASLKFTHGSEYDFCGKHVTGYIVMKSKEGGVAHWKSQLFEGYVYIEFSNNSLYLNSELVNDRWKVLDLQGRPCNLYVTPVPHHTVGEYRVSLKATCGWIGKKPPHLPSPGTQLLPKIDLSSVHVTQEKEESSDCDESYNSILDTELGNSFEGNFVYESEDEDTSTNSPEQLKMTSVVSPANEKLKENGHAHRIQNTPKVNETQTLSAMLNLEANNAKNSPVKRESSPKDETVKGSNLNGIWYDVFKEKNHRKGTLLEVHSSVGQIEGEDGSVHLFNQECCYLYGIPLKNVELWHVLAQGDQVLYTVQELIPGIEKVQGVWIGALKLIIKSATMNRIQEWCEAKMVPDGARDILLGQLDLL